MRLHGLPAAVVYIRSLSIVCLLCTGLWLRAFALNRPNKPQRIVKLG